MEGKATEEDLDQQSACERHPRVPDQASGDGQAGSPPPGGVIDRHRGCF